VREPALVGLDGREIGGEVDREVKLLGADHPGHRRGDALDELGDIDRAGRASILPASARVSWRTSSTSWSSDCALRLIDAHASFCLSVTGP